MKKTLLLFMAVLTLGVTARAADGDEFTVDNFKYQVLSEANHEVSITGYETEPTGDLVIPSYVSNNALRYFVTSIGNEAFTECRSLTSVTIPNFVTEIGEGAFQGCLSLTSVSIPNSVTKIGRYAFYLGNLTSVTIPNSVTEIGEAAFSACSSLTSVTIPNSVTEIGSFAFSSCGSLTSVTIPNSVTEIGAGTFLYCYRLTSVTIPNSVTKIGDQAFGYCRSLKTIFAFPPTPPSCGDEVFVRVPSDAVVYVPKGSFKAYFVADGWSNFTDVREMGALVITLSESTISIEEGETATLTATVTKYDDVTVESETWSTSDSEVATVANGVVTAVGKGTATIIYTVVDGSGMPHTESCEVTVTEQSGIEDIEADNCDATAEYYNLNGVKVNGNALAPGIYIKRQGDTTSKIIVK